MNAPFIFPTDTRHAIPWFAIRAVDGYVDEYKEVNGDWIYFNSRIDRNIKHNWQIFDETYQSAKKTATDLVEYQKVWPNPERPPLSQLDLAEEQDRCVRKSKEENNLLDCLVDLHTQDTCKTASHLENPTDLEVSPRAGH